MAGTGTAVAGITVAALVAVGALAAQAAHTAPDHRVPVAATTPAAPPSPGGSTSAPAKPSLPPLPANSGTGKRVVYSPTQGWVWLVGVDSNGAEVTLRTYPVVPGSVRIRADQYIVTRKNLGPGTGTDKVTIRNTVVFSHSSSGQAIGISGTETPLDQIGSAPDAEIGPDGASPAASGPRHTTGAGARSSLQDSQALYEFTDLTTPVWVVG